MSQFMQTLCCNLYLACLAEQTTRSSGYALYRLCFASGGRGPIILSPVAEPVPDRALVAWIFCLSCSGSSDCEACWHQNEKRSTATAAPPKDCGFSPRLPSNSIRPRRLETLLTCWTCARTVSCSLTSHINDNGGSEKHELGGQTPEPSVVDASIAEKGKVSATKKTF